MKGQGSPPPPYPSAVSLSRRGLKESEGLEEVGQGSEEVEEVDKGLEEVPKAQVDGMGSCSGSMEDSMKDVELAPGTLHPHRAGQSPSHPNLEEG